MLDRRDHIGGRDAEPVQNRVGQVEKPACFTHRIAPTLLFRHVRRERVQEPVTLRPEPVV